MLIHFAHANGIPSKVYRNLFQQLQDEYQVIYLPQIGTDERYPITNHWPHLVNQVIDSVVQQSQGQKVIGMGHSLGAVLTLMAALQRPELFSQVIMLDPPLILGHQSFAFHLAKIFSPQMIDKITPAGLSAKRREHWDSRKQAAETLGDKPFYQHFDPESFQAYIEEGLQEDHLRGGVTLTIPREAEVAIFRTTPSWWWWSKPKPKIQVDLIVGRESVFYKKGISALVQKKMSIPLQVVEGGHMFPLEHPENTAKIIKACILRTH